MTNHLYKLRTGELADKPSPLSVFIGSNIFALIVGGLYEYFSLRGIGISIVAGRMVLGLIGLICIFGIYTSNLFWGKGVRRHQILAFAFSASVAIFLILIDTWTTVVKAREFSAAASAARSAERKRLEDYRSLGWITFTSSTTNDERHSNATAAQMQVWLGDESIRFNEVKLLAITQETEGKFVRSDLHSLLNEQSNGFATLLYYIAPNTRKIKTCLTVRSTRLAATYTIIQDFDTFFRGNNTQISSDGNPTVLATNTDAVRNAC